VGIYEVCGQDTLKSDDDKLTFEQRGISIIHLQLIKKQIRSTMHQITNKSN
jgi:hypothetical protein